MVCAHCSKASLLVPKPKLRAKVRKKGLFPVAFALGKLGLDALCLLLETLGLQAGEPAVEQEFGQARDEAVAGRVMAGFNQLAVVV